ncbi:MAG TPA: hypothetical protein PK734_00070 [Bacteroidales bacterium]|nr:MAG: hypothetical protein BWY22_00019 [Bacteroidetes bacterium ADurb.Bin217]HPM11869.1 hypothetical protein [Bacteroidales bacterium]
MSLQKKILTAIILICLIGIISFFYVFMKKKTQVIQNNVYELIADNTVAFVEIKTLSDLFELQKSEHVFWDDISKLPLFSTTSQFAFTLDSVISKRTEFSTFLQNNFIVSLLQVGKHKLENVFFIPLIDEQQKAVVNQLFEQAYPHLTLHSYDYDGKCKINNFLEPGSKVNKLSYTISNNCIIVSASRVHIENAVRAFYDKTHVLQNEQFVKVKKTAGSKVYANIFVNFKHVSKALSLIVADEAKQSFSESNFFGSWSEFDITPKDNALLLNGFTAVSSDEEYLSIFKNQQAVKLSITSIIPAGIAGFVSLGISNGTQFRNSYEAYLRKTDAYNPYKQGIAEINSAFSASNQDAVNIIAAMNECIADEVAVVYGNAGETNIYENSFAVCKTKGKQQALDVLLPIFDSYCEKTKKNMSDITTTYTLDNSSVYTMYALPVATIPEVLWGKLFSKVQAKYVTFIEDYLIFGSSIQALQRYVSAYELQKILANEQEFKKIQNNILSTYTIYAYSQVSKSTKFYEDIVDEESKSQIQKQSELLKKCNSLVVQISVDHEMFYNNIYLNYSGVQEEKPQTVWESYIDTAIICKPKFVDTQAGDITILVQDGFYNLILLNNSGKIQWKKPLKEPIISEFYLIDYFKNGKTQYLFNTASAIYIVDRLGNFVDSYPLKLKSSATAGISVFDYDKNKEYRVFVPCANKKIYLYTIKGHEIKDWKFGQTETEVTTPLQHFVAEGKDYIVFADKFNMYIVNRKGETRVTVQEQIQKSHNNTFTLEPTVGKVPARIVTTDVQGNVKFIEFSGKVSTLELSNRSPNHFFEYRDFNNDGSNDFMFLDNQELEIISQQKKNISNFVFQAPITMRPVVYKFSDNVYKIGVVDNTNSKVYVINGNGTLHKGFPLKGKSLFTIGFLYKHSNTFNLIIGGEENFLYNYEIK